MKPLVSIVIPNYNYGHFIKQTIESAVKQTYSNVEIVVVDDGKNHIYPTSTLSNGTDKVYVGRIRRDLSCKNGLLLYCTADNIRKGAASNAIQIVEKLIEFDNN